MKTATRDLILCGVFAAIISVFSVMAIPIGPVPITLALFAVLLTAVVLGALRAFFAALIYLLLGAVGLPVFSGFVGGFTAFFGPTGGFLLAYPIAALAAGAICGLGNGIGIKLLGTVVGVLIIYIKGASYYTFICKTDLRTAIAVCVLPFVLGDALKCVFAALIGRKLAARLAKIK